MTGSSSPGRPPRSGLPRRAPRAGRPCERDCGATHVGVRLVLLRIASYRGRAMSDAERFDAFYADDPRPAAGPRLRPHRRPSRLAQRRARHLHRRLAPLVEGQASRRPGGVGAPARVEPRPAPPHRPHLAPRPRLDPGLRATLDALAQAARDVSQGAAADPAHRDVTAGDGPRGRPAPGRGGAAPAERDHPVLAPARGARRARCVSCSSALIEHCADQRWPRATIIRRAGHDATPYPCAGRRRAGRRSPGRQRVPGGRRPRRPPDPRRGGRPDHRRAPAGTGDAVLAARAPADHPGVPGHQGADAARSARPHLADHRHRSHQDTTLPCQRRAYADPKASTALVRNFTTATRRASRSSPPSRRMELSTDVRPREDGYDAATGWFAECLVPQMQLLAVHRVKRLGDEAAAVRPADLAAAGDDLRARRRPHRPDQHLTLTRTAGAGPPTYRQPAAAGVRGRRPLLGDARRPLLGAAQGGRRPAPPAGDPPMMLSEFDLPPAAGVQQPWAGTTPRQAMQNLASTGCDRARFHGGGWKHAATRTFLVPGATWRAAFGHHRDRRPAPRAEGAAFVDGVRVEAGVVLRPRARHQGATPGRTGDMDGLAGADPGHREEDRHLLHGGRPLAAAQSPRSASCPTGRTP